MFAHIFIQSTESLTYLNFSIFFFPLPHFLLSPSFIFLFLQLFLFSNPFLKYGSQFIFSSTTYTYFETVIVKREMDTSWTFVHLHLPYITQSISKGNAFFHLMTSPTIGLAVVLWSVRVAPYNNQQRTFSHDSCGQLAMVDGAQALLTISTPPRLCRHHPRQWSPTRLIHHQFGGKSPMQQTSRDCKRSLVGYCTVSTPIILAIIGEKDRTAYRRQCRETNRLINESRRLILSGTNWRYDIWR